MTSFRNYLSSFTFAPNSKVRKLMSTGKATDLELAAACTTTKAYNENKDLAKEVNGILSGAADSSEKKEPALRNDPRRGEPRSY